MGCKNINRTKHRKALNYKLDSNIYDVIDSYCEGAGLTKTTAVE